MLDKKQQSQRYNQHSATQDKKTNKFRYSHLDLCFSYCKPKPKQRKQLSPIAFQPNPPQQPQYLDHPKFRLSCRLSQKKQQFPQTSSTSFFKKSTKTPVYQEKAQLVSQGDQMPYIGWGFPQRKRKSGDQQFLKLLLKYSDNLLISNTKPRERSEGPLEDNPEKNEKTKPKLKTRTRLNWVKDRYCVNRDRQGGVFCSPVAEEISKGQQLTFRGSWRLRKQQR